MNFKLIIIVFLLVVNLSSCSKDELKDVELGFNYYDEEFDASNSINIISTYDLSYSIHPTTRDTSLVKIYINLNYDAEIFNDDVFTNNLNVVNEFYLNDAPYQLRKESGTNRYFIQPGWSLVKNKNNSIKFLFRFFKDEKNPLRRKLASNEFFFQF